MALEHAQRRGRVSSVVLIWPSTNVPPRVRELLETVKYAHGARVAAIKIQPDAVERIMSYLNTPEEAPEVHRPLIEYMRYYGIRELPALVVDNSLVAVGEEAVLASLQRLLHRPAIA